MLAQPHVCQLLIVRGTQNLWRVTSWLAPLKLSANPIDLIRQGGVSGLNFDFNTLVLPLTNLSMQGVAHITPLLPLPPSPVPSD